MNSKIKNKLSRFGYKIEKIIGQGSFGRAYLLSNGFVLKETEDEIEARIASKIAGKNIPHVYRVFRVLWWG